MKIQCSCGAKYAFEITPEIASRPVQFVCPACGADASEFVNSLVRQELGQAETPEGPVVRILDPGPSRVAAAPAPAQAPVARVRVHAPAASPAVAMAGASD